MDSPPPPAFRCSLSFLRHTGVGLGRWKRRVRWPPCCPQCWGRGRRGRAPPLPVTQEGRLLTLSCCPSWMLPRCSAPPPPVTQEKSSLPPSCYPPSWTAPAPPSAAPVMQEACCGCGFALSPWGSVVNRPTSSVPS